MLEILYETMKVGRLEGRRLEWSGSRLTRHGLH